MKTLLRITAVILVGVVLMIATEGKAEEMEIRCIIGEAADQGFEGMTAVGEAIRNRVYGCKSKMPDTQPEWVWVKAREAWEKSKHSNLVNGATHWESIDFPAPWWADDMIETVKIRKHIFYKER
jgi:spore germination cell wall hydrolase CwlJ-like protein